MKPQIVVLKWIPFVGLFAMLYYKNNNFTNDHKRNSSLVAIWALWQICMSIISLIIVFIIFLK